MKPHIVSVEEFLSQRIQFIGMQRYMSYLTDSSTLQPRWLFERRYIMSISLVGFDAWRVGKARD